MGLNHFLALKSGWKAGVKQFRKRLTELRRGPPSGNFTIGPPTSGVPVTLGLVQQKSSEPLAYPIRGPGDEA